MWAKSPLNKSFQIEFLVLSRNKIMVVTYTSCHLIFDTQYHRVLLRMIRHDYQNWCLAISGKNIAEATPDNEQNEGYQSQPGL